MATFKPLRYKEKGGDCMLMLHEILGTDEPIFKEKQANYFFFEELLALNEKPSQYKITGYIEVRKNKQLFFKQVYS